MDRRAFLAAAGAASLAIPTVSHSFDVTPAQPARPDVAHGFEPWLDIKRDSLTWNVVQLSRKAGNRPILAVLKDNAYGHGLVGVARHFETLPQVYGYAVVKIQEAIDLKANGVKKPVVLLGPTTDEELAFVVAQGVIPSVYTDRSALLRRLSAKVGGPIHIHVYVDTGMGRVGVPYDQALPVIEAMAGQKEIVFDGILSELAEDDAFDIEQARRLTEIYEQARKKGIPLGLRHAGSSGAIFHSPDALLDMVRPGISLYGGYPDDRSEQAKELVLKSTFDFKTRVMSVKKIKTGDTLMYGREYLAKKPTWIATLPVGHSDGWPRTTANTCMVGIKGRLSPIIASLSANHCLVDLGDETSVQMGDEALLIGESGGATIEAHDVGRKTGVGMYTLLMHLNPWLGRRYL